MASQSRAYLTALIVSWGLMSRCTHCMIRQKAALRLNGRETSSMHLCGDHFNGILSRECKPIQDSTYNTRKLIIQFVLCWRVCINTNKQTTYWLYQNTFTMRSPQYYIYWQLFFDPLNGEVLSAMTHFGKQLKLGLEIVEVLHVVRYPPPRPIGQRPLTLGAALSLYRPMKHYLVSLDTAEGVCVWGGVGGSKREQKNKKLMVESDKSSIVKIHTINKF